MYCFSQSRPWLYLSGLFRNWRECLVGTWHYLKLRFSKVPEKTVLLVEFNPFHGETLPGYVYYFQQLGYEVTVLTRYCSYADSPFVRMTEKPQHICLTIWGMRHYLQSAKTREYEYIFYNSTHLFLKEYRYYGRVPEFLGGRLTEGRRGCGMIEHEFCPGSYRDTFHRLPEESGQKQLLFHNTFMLTPQEFDGHTIPMLNPCYFGDVKKEHVLGASGKRVFITIGNVSRQSRNFPALVEALKQLGPRDDYEVWIIGRLLEPEVLNGVGKNVKVLGRLSFAEMYNRLEQADLYLPLLDPEQNGGYLDGCTSGSRQLILGFAIPPIVHRIFADHFGLGNSCAVCYYEATGFADALKCGMTLQPAEHERMGQAIQTEAECVRSISLMNLRRHLQM